MSTDSVRRVNLGAIACAPRPQLPDGFRRHSVRVGATLGAERSGLSVYELPPGQAVSPYHYEEPEEEWLLVVSGTPTLRHPDGEEQLAPWDIAAGILLVREAGGVVTNLEGGPAPVAHTGIIAGNQEMHAWLHQLLGAKDQGLGARD